MYYLVDAGLLAVAVVSVCVSVTPLTVSSSLTCSSTKIIETVIMYVHVKSANYDTHMY